MKYETQDIAGKLPECNIANKHKGFRVPRASAAADHAALLVDTAITVQKQIELCFGHKQEGCFISQTISLHYPLKQH